jgi:hypothetical protein
MIRMCIDGLPGARLVLARRLRVRAPAVVTMARGAVCSVPEQQARQN